MVTAYAAAEYFTCPRKACGFLKNGVYSVQSAAHAREYLRVLAAFCAHTASSARGAVSSRGAADATTAANNTAAETAQNPAAAAPLEAVGRAQLEQAARDTAAFFKAAAPGTLGTSSAAGTPSVSETKKAARSLSCAVLSSDGSLYAAAPLCSWNADLQGWDFHFPTSAGAKVGLQGERPALRQEQKIYAACALREATRMGITVSKIFLHTLIVPEKEKPDLAGSFGADIAWVHSDITAKIAKHLESMEADLAAFIALAQSEAARDEAAWASCGREYCEVCSADVKYETDDVRTLRKSKQTVEELLHNGITKISEIPDAVELHASAQRQVQAVKSGARIFVPSEVEQFLSRLAYPRYYLDFEAFSTASPVFAGVQPWGFVPFLFSLQSQEAPEAGIQTRLWAMPAGADKRALMWKEIKEHLRAAGSIVVYSRSFEDDMIRQLASLAGEPHIAQSISRKIADLQNVFFYLSAYDPNQKGKISLKSLAPAWLGGDYKTFVVKEGMEANYFYTAMCDDKLRTFEALRACPYAAGLLDSLRAFDASRTITLKDIADYCKYDTEVMIRLVAVLEQLLRASKAE